MTGPTPAAWYPDPFGRHDARYWDGAQWTHHVRTRGGQQVDPPVSLPQAPTAPVAPAADWYPDPFGRHEARYWDGARWTDHVTTRGHQTVDPPVIGAPAPVAVPGPTTQTNVATADPPRKKVQRQVRRAGVVGDDRKGRGSLFSERVLVVNQKPKLIEVNAEYTVYDQDGQRIGAVREVGQSLMRNTISPRPVASRTKRLQVVDPEGRVHLTLTRPATMARSTVTVRRTDGAEVGQIVQKNLGLVGKVRFDLVHRGDQIGSIRSEGWNVWDFSIQDGTGDEVARITKSGVNRRASTKRDKYVVEIHRDLEDPLRALVLAAALAVDTALRQQR